MDLCLIRFFFNQLKVQIKVVFYVNVGNSLSFDQHLTSPNNINTMSTTQVMRIKIIINLDPAHTDAFSLVSFCRYVFASCPY